MSGESSAFEQRVSAALQAQRPSEGPSAAMRARVLDISSSRSGAPWIARHAWVLAAGVIASALAVSAVVVHLGPLSPSVLQPGAPGSGIDAMVEGPEVITSLTRTLPFVGWAAAAMLAVLAVRLVIRARRDRRLVLNAAALALGAIGAVGLVLHPGPGVGGWNGYGPVLGFRMEETPNTTDENGDRLLVRIVSAGPGEPFAFFFVVHNPGPLTVRLEGIHEDESAKLRIAPRWTALGLASDVNTIGGPLTNAVPFHPVDIPPDGDIGLYVIGKASACTVGSGPFETDQAFAVRGPDIDLVYSLFGLTNTSTYHMPLVIEEPLINGCTG